MRLNTTLLLIALLNTCISTAQAQKAVVSKQWKNECVGHFQISVPGEVEVALLHYYDDKKTYNFYTKMQQRAFYTFTNFGGKIGVFSEFDKALYLKHRQAEVDRLEKYRIDNKENAFAATFVYSFPNESSFLVKYGDSSSMEIESSTYDAGRYYTY